MICNTHDRAFTPKATSSPTESGEATIYTALIWHATFHIATNHIYTRIMSSPPLTGTETLLLDDTLVQWYSKIPEYLEAYPKADTIHWLRFGQYKMAWRYHNLRIILHRRVFLERALRRSLLIDYTATSDDLIDAKCESACMDSAAATIFSIKEFFDNCVGKPSRLASWYGLYV